ncbi:hypothetical protein PPL_05061 [Heterostelium album PN500]|uniref:P-type ATPase C-terminal domain-containing protein n=1 Tax=Heterostelium pallidum (strain ATCC 26659 / Pp 5 / PN500) TaxID=670386 RepID=D3B9B7_HETP5|nr:hypothetical protein PPL_05061 [Heterostelium album PN500]EFA81829.1 hypothetical protein PPL_05061 [Heterostelium album PN500]|eukprot:XP_020433946.1 hypothetical protein PPL_05061 [Heterostelium album PN500]
MECWNTIQHLATWLSILVFIVFELVYSKLAILFGYDFYYNLALELITQPNFYLTVIITILICLLPVYLYIFAKRNYYPIPLNIIQEIKKKNSRDVDDTDRSEATELNDLNHGDVFLPPDGTTQCAVQIEVIHKDMYKGVEENYPQLQWPTALQEVPAEPNDNAVVIDVQENQWFLSQHDDDSIKEFVEL